MPTDLELNDPSAKLMLAGAPKYRPKPSSVVRAVKVPQPFQLPGTDPFPAGSYLAELKDGSLFAADAKDFERLYEQVPKRTKTVTT